VSTTAELRPGDPHWQAYVGPPRQYDFMGATQFRLLCALGLRAHHDVLDLGCGSLRAGRLLLVYLESGRYHGIEPNRWLVREGIRREVGRFLAWRKRPRFDHNADFRCDGFGKRFHYVVAQSIFSHAGKDLVRHALGNVREALRLDGLFLATFVHGDEDFTGDGWIYPECVAYRPDTVRALADESGLAALPIPWYHPRQHWWLLAREAAALPTPEEAALLNGVVLRDPEFRPGVAAALAAADAHAKEGRRVTEA